MKRSSRELTLIAVFLLTFPLVAFVSSLPPQRFRNAITEWGDHQSQTYQNFIDYREKFGINEFVVFTWPGCDLNDRRVLSIVEGIETDLDKYVQQVSSGQQAYWELRDRGRLSDAAALARLRNIFIAEESLATAIGFNLTPIGRAERGKVVTALGGILESAGVDPATARFAGLGHNLYTLDKEGLESPFRMVPQIMLMSLVLTIFFVRNTLLAFFINAFGTYTGCLSFNFIFLADIDMNAIIWPLPTLTMLLSVSASLHFLGYFRKAVHLAVEADPAVGKQALSLQQRRAITRDALQLAIKPTLYCTLTTAIGLLSLVFSTCEPVRQFGFFGAMSIATANLLLLIWFPAFLTLIRYADRLIAERSLVRNEGVFGAIDRWHLLARFTQKFRWFIVVGSFLFLAWCAAGVPKITTGSNLNNFFPAGHQVLEDAVAVEQSTGPLNSVELLLTFKNHDSENDRSRLRGIKALSSRIIEETSFTSCISAATFEPRWRNQPSRIQQITQKKRLDKLKEEMVEAGLLSSSSSKKEESWRVSCRYSTLQQVDLPELNRTLRRIVADLFYRDGELVFAGEHLEVSTTGEFVLFDYIDRQFFRELMTTYVTAFGVIMLIVLLVLRTPRAMLAGLLPNLFPAVAVLGITGHLGFKLDVASLMTASVALGIAVDDTLHFLIWHRDSPAARSDSQSESHSQSHSLTPAQASVENAMRYSGKAMLQTSLILGGSVFLYAFCGFLPTVRFGVLLSAMMFAALVGDLLLLPALLAEPNGRGERKTKSTAIGLEV